MSPRLIGPYEVVGPLGAGGMGEVLRARDPRMGREVAIKLLPAESSSDPELQRRFEQEVRAAGALNHPNVLAVHDTGRDNGTPYLVSELLEGETLRARVAQGALPLRTAIDYAVQVSRGLAAAHDKGIVHRDLKPENLFVTSDGRVKILDFGLARVMPLAPTDAATASVTPGEGTKPGTVMGTVGYMAPEQVRGQPADARTDIFALGVVLHEMLTGRRAFRADTPVETLSAILKEDPPPPSESRPEVPTAVDRIVRRCLEKQPGERFHSARDVGFALEALGEPSGRVAAPAAEATARRRSWLLPIAALLLPVAAAAGAWFARRPEPELPQYQRLTYRRGAAWTARFSPDGQTIYYTAQWDGEPERVYAVRPENSESQVLADGHLHGVSRTGELALALQGPPGPPQVPAVLARMPLAGGLPRQVLDDVVAADWSPDGTAFAVVRAARGKPARLEYPVGTVLFEAAANAALLSPRVSPDGQRVAFVIRPRGDLSGQAVVIDARTRTERRSPDLMKIITVAWRGDEVWLSGALRLGDMFEIHAVDPQGRMRLVARGSDNLIVQDVAADGRALVVAFESRIGILYKGKDDTRERELGWMDGSTLSDMTPDGAAILFTELGLGGRDEHGVYLRRTDGSPAVRLGPGHARALSSDGRLALTAPEASSRYLEVVPTGPGETRRVEGRGLFYWSARFLSDNRRFVAKGNLEGRPPRLFVQSVDGEAPVPLTPEGVSGWGVSIDGTSAAAAYGGSLMVHPIGGGKAIAMEGVQRGQSVFAGGFFDDRYALLAPGPGARRIFRLDRRTGQQELFLDFVHPDPAGIHSLWWLNVATEGRGWAVSYARSLGDVYLVTGLR